MIPRGTLDISTKAIFNGIRLCIKNLFGFSVHGIGQLENGFYALSARTGLDLALTALDLKHSDEILVSNINIPDIFEIIASHQLKSIPIAIREDNLGLSIAEVTQNITSKTKAILVTHLFGAIMDMDELAKLANKHNLIVIEDCAQAFDGSYRGHPLSTVVLYSFGLIKTNTALTGAFILVNDQTLLLKMNDLNTQLPTQNTGIYFKKLVKALVIKLLTTRRVYTFFYWVCGVVNADFDNVIGKFSKGFKGDEVMKKIKFRPCEANLQLLNLRLKEFNRHLVEKRKLFERSILTNIPNRNKVGYQCKIHTHWVIPISVENPVSVINLLRKNGFDATNKASSLIKLNHSPLADNEVSLSKLVYLPMAVNMNQKDKHRLNGLLQYIHSS